MSTAFIREGDSILYAPTGEEVRSLEHLNELVEIYVNMCVDKEVGKIVDERMKEEMVKFNSVVESKYVMRTPVDTVDTSKTKNAHRGRPKGSRKIDGLLLLDIYKEYKSTREVYGKPVSYSKLAKKYKASDKTIKKYILEIEASDWTLLADPAKPLSFMDLILTPADPADQQPPPSQ